MIDRLRAHGVDHVFGIPGTHNLPFYRELEGSGIRHVTCRHEQGLGYAADGYARSTGRPGVCLTTTGPALLNVASAAATAHADSIPMLILSPGLPAGIEGRDAGFLHQGRPQVDVMRALLGNSHRATGAADAAAAVDEAMASFACARPRPRHIEVPLDVLDSSEEVGPPAQLPARPATDSGAADAAAGLLHDAGDAVIVLGGGSVGCQDVATRLAERLRAPVVTTANGKGVVDEANPLSLGSTLALPTSQEVLRDAEVVLAVGTELGQSDLGAVEEALELRGRLIRIDIDPEQLHKNAAAALPINASAEAALEAIHSRLPEDDGRDRGGAQADALRTRLAAEAQPKGGEYADLIDRLGDSLEPDSVLAGDSTKACYYGVLPRLKLSGPRRFLYPAGYATLGYALPAAVGAKLAEPSRQVVALLGDGGIMFTLAELATAVEQALPIAVLIVNDEGYGEIRDEMREKGQEQIGVNLRAPDFLAVAAGFGAAAHRLRDLDELPPLIRDAARTSVPTVIEIPQAVLS